MLKRLALALLCVLLCMTGAGAVSEEQGEHLTLDGVCYTLTGSTAAVSGCTEEVPEELVIPASVTDRTGNSHPVTGIENGAFAGPQALQKLTIPRSVKVIHNSGIYCPFVRNLTIPGSVTGLDKYAIIGGDFESLSKAVFPNSLSRLEDKAFQGAAVKRVTIPENVTRFHCGAVSSCPNLDTIEFLAPAENLTIEGYASSSSLEYIYVPASDLAAYQEKLALHVPDSVRIIASRGPAPDDLLTQADNSDVGGLVFQDAATIKLPQGLKATDTLAVVAYASGGQMLESRVYTGLASNDTQTVTWNYADKAQFYRAFLLEDGWRSLGEPAQWPAAQQTEEAR